MLKKILSFLQYIIFLGAGIFLVWWQLRSMTPEERTEFSNAFTYADYWMVVPVVIMSLLSHLSRAMRWKLLLEPLGYRPKLKNVFAVTMVGYLANAAVPRLGEILKCTFLARYEDLKVDKLVGSILVERTFDFICYLIFIGITVFIQINLIGGFLKEELSAFAGKEGFPLWARLAVYIIILVLVIYTLRMMVRKYPDNKFFRKLNSFFKGIGKGFAAIKNLQHRKLFLAHTFFIWLMYLLQIYIGFLAMSATSHLSINAAFSILSLATLAMIITPGGIGSFPLFVGKTLVLYGIALPLGEAFGWLMWGVNTGIVIVAGLSALLLLPLMNRKTTLIPALANDEETSSVAEKGNT